MTKPNYQVFENEDELKEYVINADPMKTFTPSKREIGWDPPERICNECKKTFKPGHPAQHYCVDCQNKEVKVHKRGTVVAKMKANPIPSKCVDCGHNFYKTAPAMRKCEVCSATGGERIH